MAFGNDTCADIERVKALVPDWLAIEHIYANSKHQDNNPQTTVFEGGLLPGGVAYQDFFGYLGRFVIYYEQGNEERITMLRASQQLGKFVGVARALVSAINQREHNLTLDEGDQQTMTEFEKRWFAIGDLGIFPEDNFKEVIPDMVEKRLELLHGVVGDLSTMQEYATELLIDEAKLFGAFTLREAVMATPGIASSDTPTAWI